MSLALMGSFLLAAGGIVIVTHGAVTSQEKQEKGLKKVPIQRSQLHSGKQMFKDYCAACHGMDGKGNGPAAEFLKNPPNDLTVLAKANNGKFPAEHFGTVLRSGTEKHPHGTLDMPTWGPLFRSLDQDFAELRIHNLRSYVESLQQK